MDTLLNSPSDEEATTTSQDKWADALDDLDQDSEESECGEDSDIDASIEGDIHGKGSSIQQLGVEHKNNKPNPSFIGREPKPSAALFPYGSGMPELKRMKHLPVLESIVEEDLKDGANVIAQTMQLLPAALHTLQALQTLQIAEMNAIVRITEIEIIAEAETSLDTGSMRLSTSSIVAAAS